MRPGNLVHMSTFKHVQPTVTAGFAAPKGRLAVFMFLGDVDKKNPDAFDAMSALKNLGWLPVPELVENLNLEVERRIFERIYPVPDSVAWSPAEVVYVIDCPDQYRHDGMAMAAEHHNNLWSCWIESAQARDEAWS